MCVCRIYLFETAEGNFSTPFQAQRNGCNRSQSETSEQEKQQSIVPQASGKYVLERKILLHRTWEQH